MNILLTGASGFVGSAILEKLNEQKHNTTIVTRNKSITTSTNEQVVVKGIDSHTEWGDFLSSVDVVIHAAARVHVMNEISLDPLEDFREVNTRGTLRLADQAVLSKVKRFVFISSIKVNGEKTNSHERFSAEDIPGPQDPYGISKFEAEKGLMKIAEETGMEVVIIRPPLVYGPGVKANFESMMKWLNQGIPLPFGAIKNSRSLVALDNLVSLIITCISHHKASGQVFMISDDNDLSTTRLLDLLADYLGAPKRLLPIPQKLLEIGAKLIGREDLAVKLCSSLRIDISKTKTLLGWAPPLSVEAALKNTALYYLDSYKKLNVPAAKR